MRRYDKHDTLENNINDINGINHIRQQYYIEQRDVELHGDYDDIANH